VVSHPLLQLNVSGLSTFVGVATFKNDVYIDGDLYVGDDLVFDEFRARNGNITGILTVGQSFYYPKDNLMVLHILIRMTD
jgi:hypothetical protein